jgi:hypothetical protein
VQAITLQKAASFTSVLIRDPSCIIVREVGCIACNIHGDEPMIMHVTEKLEHKRQKFESMAIVSALPQAYNMHVMSDGRPIMIIVAERREGSCEAELADTKTNEPTQHWQLVYSKLLKPFETQIGRDPRAILLLLALHLIPRFR